MCLTKRHHVLVVLRPCCVLDAIVPFLFFLFYPFDCLSLSFSVKLWQFSLMVL